MSRVCPRPGSVSPASTPETFEHVRPTTPQADPITRNLLREEGGPFGVGAVVDLGAVVPEPTSPEAEDHKCRTADARYIEDMGGDEFLALLDEVSAPDLASAFGPALERIGWKYAVETGRGECSLAVLRAGKRLALAVDERFGKLQLRFNDVDPPTYLAVTDVRFYEGNQETIKISVVEDVSRRLHRGVDAFLMLGLARAYQASTDDRERHWLQLNGLCLADSPAGDILRCLADSCKPCPKVCPELRKSEVTCGHFESVRSNDQNLWMVLGGVT
jgi:hypothetical protein